MLNTRDALRLGGNAGGLSIPGALHLGNSTAGPVAPDAPDVIDLTKPELDSRIIFHGSPHLFWNEHGELELSTGETWPLEYRDGVAVGRHEPELMATNLQPRSRAVETGDFLRILRLGVIFSENGAPDGGASPLIPVEALTYAIAASTGAWLYSPVTYELTEQWQRIAIPITLTKSQIINIYLGRNGKNGNCINTLLLNSLNTGTYTVSFFCRKHSETHFAAGLIQIESGSRCTSPIINEGDNVGTRQAQSATVNTAGRSSITVEYSDGQSDTYATPDDLFTLPFATENWGERYIQYIHRYK